jgi:hypothetical protein
LGQKKTKIFLQKGLDSQITDLPDRRFSQDVAAAGRCDRRSVKPHMREETEHKTFIGRCSAATTKRNIAMKLTTIALATVFALSSTFALAQAGGAAGGSAGSSTTGGASMSGSTTGTTTGGTTGMGSGTGTSAGTATQNPNNPVNPSGNTLAPNASPSGSTLGPTGPGTGR